MQSTSPPVRAYLYVTERAGVEGVDNFFRTVRGGESGSLHLPRFCGTRIILSTDAGDGNQIATCSLVQPRWRHQLLPAALVIAFCIITPY